MKEVVTESMYSSKYHCVAFLLVFITVFSPLTSISSVLAATDGSNTPNGSNNATTTPITNTSPGNGNGFVEESTALNYVALGDSRAAVPQTDEIGLTPCDRSRSSYPDLVAEYIHTSHEINVSCVKATISNLFLPQRLGKFVAPPQIDALNSSTQVVTISIGGNDIRWFAIVAPCFTAVYGQDAHCRTNPNVAKKITMRLANLRPSLTLALQTIQARAPLAKIFVVGHGGYFGTTGCRFYAQSSPEDLRFIAQFFQRFNSVLAQVAQANSANFVGIMPHTVGHDACQAPGTAWFSGTRSEDQTPPDHPTKEGSAAMASIVASAIRTVFANNHESLPENDDQNNSFSPFNLFNNPQNPKPSINLLDPPSSQNKKSDGISLSGQHRIGLRFGSFAG